MGPSIVEWKKAVAKLCVKKPQCRGAPPLLPGAGSQKVPGGTRGRGTKGPFSSHPGQVLVERACGAFRIRKASGGVLQDRERFRDLLGQGNRKAENSLVCFWRTFSRVLTPVPPLAKIWARNASDLGTGPGPAGSRWRGHVQMCPGLPPAPHAPASSDLPLPWKSSFTVGIHLQPLGCRPSCRPLPAPQPRGHWELAWELEPDGGIWGPISCALCSRPSRGCHQSQGQSPPGPAPSPRVPLLFTPQDLCTCTVPLAWHPLPDIHMAASGIALLTRCLPAPPPHPHPPALFLPTALLPFIEIACSTYWPHLLLPLSHQKVSPMRDPGPLCFLLSPSTLNPAGHTRGPE